MWGRETSAHVHSLKGTERKLPACMYLWIEKKYRRPYSTKRYIQFEEELRDTVPICQKWGTERSDSRRGLRLFDNWVCPRHKMSLSWWRDECDRQFPYRSMALAESGSFSQWSFLWDIKTNWREWGREEEIRKFRATMSAFHYRSK